MASDSGLFHTPVNRVWSLFMRRSGPPVRPPLCDLDKAMKYARSELGHAPRRLAQKNDRYALPVPRYWVAGSEADNRLAKRGWDKEWLLG